ncbi:ABC transporter permease [Legionella sp. W05-934-2]|jgi:ABC-2 type transport system permease protein|uniref:ABC transporter permease n=1 Tax=Legionella sp. W05-934-2 TaxID=1198649 RepID=UPI003461E13E
MTRFSLSRLWAIIRKEFLLMKRDPATVIIMAIMPLILVCIAGFAVNTFPEKVPTVLVSYDHSPLTRELVQQLENTTYFKFVTSTTQPEHAYHLLRSNQALMILTIPPNFTQAVYRHQNPSLLLEDGTVDSFSTARAVIALAGVQKAMLKKMAKINAQTKAPTFNYRIINHRLFDPELNTQFYLVPGMIGLVLMLTMLMITVIIAFRDSQGGTIEYLLVSPTRPTEILIGQILAYILVGYLQLSMGLVIAYYVFDIPFIGDLSVLYLSVLPYIIAELSLGLTIATFCATQFEAVQVINVFIAFSVILSGFVFPLFGLPDWAKTISQFLPLTYFFKILFAVMMKGSRIEEIWQHLWPLLIYSTVMITLATYRFKYQQQR